MYRDERIVIGAGCPLNPDGCDITDYLFKLSVYPATDIPFFTQLFTEVTGNFEPDASGTDDTINIAVTERLRVPVNTPISNIACQIESDFTGDTTQLVGEEMRGSVRECPCPGLTECPALNMVSLLAAMETAIAKKNGTA